ncbi:helix-turn-helix domain-containing protein [Kaistella sp. G5-32]|uniref:Helix-turn-helix domain-containing protein n=1 Tax=Kaistella gelatinilytica TaxID=2787636 RepID=A0ABS0F7C8_9FLAO|nr:helix-turn-helix domain-containing protein [Kaistella gelatinilytica]MBF8455607.1 helix-turn-helix domain-containing protein [Kaistella gelatinilytica]
MKKIVFLFSVLFYTVSFSQDMQAFNKIYYKTYVETAQTDFKGAVKVADSLFTISETPVLQARSLMLSASLYKQSGEVKKSVDYALRAGEIIQQTDNYNWQAKVYGFLATEYRRLKLYDNSRLYMEKAFDVSKNIEDPKSANNVKGLMQQEKAYYEIEKKNYKKAVVEINKAQQFFELSGANLDFFTANNEQLLGLSYYHLNEPKKALQHYNSALSFSKNDPGGFLVGLSYNGLANIYLDQKDLKNGKKYLDLAEKISKKSPYLELKNEIYTTSQKYYAATNDLKNLVSVKKQQDSVVEKLSTESTAFIDQSFTSMQKDNKRVEEKSSNKNVMLILGGLFIILGGIYFLLYRIKHKRNLEHFREILKNIEEKSALAKQRNFELRETEEINAEEQNLQSYKAEPSVSMSAETEQKILLKLKEFEESELFTDNNVSLSTLATYCESNSKYLSHIINSYKKQDFNNYINELRITYIVKKLQNFPLYRKYKIAVLSEEAGFSSQNKFATIFKKVTTISPSVFIKYLQENEEA